MAFDSFLFPCRVWALGAVAALGLAGLVDTVQACEPLAEASARQLTPGLVLERTATCHPDVLAAQRQLVAARADTQTAAQRPNPQLTLGIGSLGEDIGPGSAWDKTFDHQLRIDQLIERGDKPALRVAAARALHDAAQADVLEVVRKSRLVGLRGLYDLNAALTRQTELAATARLYAESQTAFEKREAAGDVAPLDVARFRLDALRLQSDLAQAESDVQTQRLQLAVLLGAEPVSKLLAPQLVEPANTARRLPEESVASLLATSRPDVAAASARLAAAQAARALALSQRTRDVSVGVGFSRFPASTTNTTGSGNTLSLSVTIPLFLRHSFEGELARADADIGTAEGTLRRTQLAAQTDASRALRQWLIARDRLLLASNTIYPAAEKVAAGAELAYRRGASTVLDALEARRALRSARIERISALAEFAKADVELDAVLLIPDSLSVPVSK